MTGNRWLIVVLVLSLAINFALAGFFIGRASNIDLQRSVMDPTLGFSRILGQLSDERRSELRPLIRNHFRDMRPSLKGIRQAQIELNQTLTAEPFDARALAVALEQFREHLSSNQSVSNASLVALVTALEPGERRLLIESMHRGRRHQAPSRRPPPQRSAQPDATRG